MMGPDKHETQPGRYLTGQVIAAYRSRERFQTVPYEDCLPERQVKGPREPRERDFADSTCIWVFLSSLKNNHFFSNQLNDSFNESTRKC